jgi:glycine cleavage system H protein
VKPEELLYAKTHEWVRLENADGGKLATIGISEFALQQLTDLVYIGLPEVGQQVAAGESFGEIESVKAVSDLYSPVTGEIVAVNEALKDSLETFSQDPYGAGWVVKMRVTDTASLNDLMDFAAYQRQCAEEA